MFFFFLSFSCCYFTVCKRFNYDCLTYLCAMCSSMPVCRPRRYKNNSITKQKPKRNNKNQSKKPIEFVQTKWNTWKIIVSANRAHDTQWHGANIWSNSFIICCTFFCIHSGIVRIFFITAKKEKKTSDIRIIQCNCTFLLVMLLQLRIDIDALTSQYILKLSA